MKRKQLVKTTNEHRMPLTLRVYSLVAITRPQLRPLAFTTSSSVKLLISNQQHGEDVVEKKDMYSRCFVLSLSSHPSYTGRGIL